jgi:tRNA (cmo5U34)-methyltransferase
MSDFKKNMGGKAYNKALELVAPYYHPLLQKLSEKLAECLKDNSNPRVIDLGCGTGVSTGYIVSALPKSAILAVDVWEDQLEAVPEDLLFSLQINWRVEDMAATLSMLPDGSLDAAVNGYAIHNLAPQERQKIYSLVAQKLKKGGLFVNTDKIAIDDEAAHQKMLEERIQEYKKLGPMGYPREAQEWMEHYRHDETIRMTEAEVEEALNKLGLSPVYFGERIGLYVLCWAVKG